MCILLSNHCVVHLKLCVLAVPQQQQKQTERHMVQFEAGCGGADMEIGMMLPLSVSVCDSSF